MADIRIHVGAGPQRLPDWINVDAYPYEGIDQVLDVREAFPFENVRFIFAEHFIEHLEFRDAATFLRRCRAALSQDGVLRISTPNLDWVWVTQYHFGSWASTDAQVQDCFNLNKGFHGWGHKFLYNRATLECALREAGFGEIVVCKYGRSRHPELEQLERHEQYADDEALPHVIVLEASGHHDGDPTPHPSQGEYLTAVDEGLT
jgi:predicted SAM-dependent methyltransferase